MTRPSSDKNTFQRFPPHHYLVPNSHLISNPVFKYSLVCGIYVGRTAGKEGFLKLNFQPNCDARLNQWKCAALHCLQTGINRDYTCSFSQRQHLNAQCSFSWRRKFILNHFVGPRESLRRAFTESPAMKSPPCIPPPRFWEPENEEFWCIWKDTCLPCSTAKR